MAARKKDAVLERIQLAAKLGDVRITRHGRERMAERNVTAEDAEYAIRTATRAIEQPKEKTIRLEGGTDVDGAALTVVVAEEQRGLRLVTVL